MLVSTYLKWVIASFVFGSSCIQLDFTVDMGSRLVCLLERPSLDLVLQLLLSLYFLGLVHFLTPLGIILNAYNIVILVIEVVLEGALVARSRD